MSKKNENLQGVPGSKGKGRVATKAKPVSGTVIGRPSSFTDSVAEEILRRVMSGDNLYKICQLPDMPNRDTVYTWLSRYPTFADNYARATSLRRELKFESLEAVVDAEEDVNRARLKVDVIKWQLSKEEPRKYGDKLDVTSGGEKVIPIIPLNTTNDVKTIDSES